MSRSGSLVRFVDDKRGVSAVIGFILIFGILVLLLTTYQAAIVPQQNAQTEFEHFEDNKNEMVELRNAISDSGQNDFSRFTSVNLGTNYQTRLLTINPPPPAGTLQTHDAPPIKIWNTSNREASPQNVSTKFIEYQPGYNELNTGPVWYEHSVLYLDERDRGNGVSIIEDQNLITEDSQTIVVTALQNDFQQTGTQRVTLELYTNESTIGDLPDEFKIQIPTRLTSRYWNETIQEDAWANSSTAVNESAYPSKNEVYGLTLNNSGNIEILNLNTVGIQSEPEVDEDIVRTTTPRNEKADLSDFSYNIISINPESGGGNDIDVEFEIDTDDPAAQVEVQSIRNDGTVRDTTGLISVSNTQPQTETIQGRNQAESVRVILYDGDGNEKERDSVEY